MDIHISSVKSPTGIYLELEWKKRVVNLRYFVMQGFTIITGIMKTKMM
jgi:hypothetical protein